MIKLKEHYSHYSKEEIRALSLIQKLIHEVASSNINIGPLEETLRWGQFTFLTTQTKSGTMVRIDRYKKRPNHIALFFHCQTKLIRIYRAKFKKKLNYDGNRAILIDITKPIPVGVLKECIKMALTYKITKKKTPP